MTPNTNEWYLSGIRSQNNKVIQAIINDFLPMITSFVRSHGGSDEDGRDIFMDAMEALLRRLAARELVLTCSFPTFLFEICKRHWFKKFRRKKYDAWVTIDDPVVFNQVQEVDEHFEKTERFRLLHDKFSLLPDACQKILSLSWHTEKSMEEIAKEVGVTYAYVRKRKSECKERLVELIKMDVRFNELKTT